MKRRTFLTGVLTSDCRLDSYGPGLGSLSVALTHVRGGCSSPPPKDPSSGGLEPPHTSVLTDTLCRFCQLCPTSGSLTLCVAHNHQEVAVAKRGRVGCSHPITSSTRAISSVSLCAFVGPDSWHLLSPI